ncbi:hypothetical protein [Halostreptopolyspora alba]|uniref:Uncharacterized protein n=1 Tax=Halostreptopolyspora alba TaxID=2487137 RepID=A0A3N0EA96_9ACTN|nr:hypothetical protein EFW17_10700 [Nocardiopsaceae bacterium YIM 96095]
MLQHRSVGLDDALAQEATEAANRVANLAAEGDWRGATDLARKTATSVADRVAEPESKKPTRAEVFERVKSHRRAADKPAPEVRIAAHGGAQRQQRPRRQ